MAATIILVTSRHTPDAGLDGSCQVALLKRRGSACAKHSILGPHRQSVSGDWGHDRGHWGARGYMRRAQRCSFAGADQSTDRIARQVTLSRFIGVSLAPRPRLISPALPFLDYEVSSPPPRSWHSLMCTQRSGQLLRATTYIVVRQMLGRALSNQPGLVLQRASRISSVSSHY